MFLVLIKIFMSVKTFLYRLLCSGAHFKKHWYKVEICKYFYFSLNFLWTLLRTFAHFGKHCSRFSYKSKFKFWQEN